MRVLPSFLPDSRGTRTSYDYSGLAWSGTGILHYESSWIHVDADPPPPLLFRS
jgi:hypothetical protein